jgi:hypothetical protein
MLEPRAFQGVETWAIALFGQLRDEREQDVPQLIIVFGKYFDDLFM